MSRHGRLLLVAVALLTVLAIPRPALAHEQREVGPYTFTVGFMNEPVYEGEQNGIWLKIADTVSGAPVEDLASMLSAEVIKGAKQRTLALEPSFGEKGVYTAMFYPTEAGDYTFRFTGVIAGTSIAETFTSSPAGFHPVGSVAELQFPNQVPPGSELAEQLAAAQQTARTALFVGGAGLAVGVLSLVIALLLILRRRRAPDALAEPATAR